MIKEILLFGLRFEMKNPKMLLDIEVEKCGHYEDFYVNIYMANGQMSRRKVYRTETRYFKELYKNFPPQPK